MAETSRERWTIAKLDELNHVVMRKLIQLDQDVRDTRVDIEGLADGRYHGPKWPLISHGLTRGGSWTDERINDLRCTVSNAVAKLHEDVHELRDEVRALRLRRHNRCGLAAQPHHSSRTCVASTIPLSSSWTDGHLDDLNHRVGVDFAQLECDIQEIQSQVRRLQTAMQNRLHARWGIPLDIWKWALAGGLYGLAIAFILSRAAHGS